MELRKVTPADRELLWNLNQKYLYEMTNYYGDELDALGNLHYGWFDAYFSDPRREAYLLYDGVTLVGFAMIHPYSHRGDRADHVLAEFTVFPMYRGRHLALAAAEEIFRRFKGRWEVKYNEKNTPAKRLWTKATEKYRPERIALNEKETLLCFRSE